MRRPTTRMRVHVAIVVAAALVCIQGVSAPLADAATTNDLLRQRIARTISASSVRSSTSVVAWNQGTREVFVDHRGGASAVPASNMKLLTSAALLEHFGPDHRFVTSVGLQGRQEGSRFVGSVVLVGGGDPSLSTRRFAVDNYGGHGASIELLALKLRARGIRSVTGRIYAVDSYLDDSRYVAEWPSRYHGAYAGALGALTVNQGYAGRWIGERGSQQPALFAGEAFRKALTRVGVTVRGGTFADDPPEPEFELVGGVQSPPLEVLLDHLNSASDNFYAEVLLRDLGRDAYGPGAGTTPRGRTKAIQTLRELGLDISHVRWVDGSGLSSRNRVPARFIAVLLGVGRQATWGEAWVDGFAISGTRGTLRRRLKQRPYRGAVHAKTGTLNSASALSGFAVRSATGGEFGFAVITSSPSGSTVNATAARSLQDSVARILVR